MEHGNGNHAGVEAEDGRGEDDVLDEENHLSDDDDISDAILSDEGSEDDNDDFFMLIERNDPDLQYKLYCIERNDPDLLKFDIGTEPSRGWEVLGERIGRNTMLNEVNIIYEPLSELGMHFFRGLAKNRSIKKLSFFISSRVCGDLLLYLIPFFMNYTSFESLRLIYLNGSEAPSEGRFDSLEYALEQFNWLKELRMEIDGRIEGAENVIQALSGHTGLRELHLLGAQMGKEGFNNLAAMLLNPSCSLSTLCLNSDIDDEMAIILSSGLKENGTLTELDLCTRLTATGWQAIFSPLKSATCMINTLNLGCNHISDTALPSLVSVLSNNNTIKVLQLSMMQNSNAFLQAMIQFLQSPSCMIQSMDLSYNSFDDEKIESLTNALANNCRLKKLNLCCKCHCCRMANLVSALTASIM